MAHGTRVMTGLPGRRRTNRPWVRVAGAVGGAAVAATVLLPTVAWSDPVVPTTAFEAALAPITANRVTGTGAAWVTLQGDQALVQVQVQGLLDGAPHAQHIHIGAQGSCPSEAAVHDGGPSITATDGLPAYGAIGTSLTLTGGTDPADALHVDDFPTTGSYTYVRTVPVDSAVRSALTDGTAVLVVHGIDYDGSGAYDDVLGVSDLDPSLPAEATDPALCGQFRPMQMTGVPVGGAETGGGSTALTVSTAAPATGSASLPAGWAVVAGVAAGWMTVSRRLRRWLTRAAH